METWPEYNFEEITFRNGAAVLVKNSPRLLYNESAQTVAIYGLNPRDHRRLLDSSASPLKDIFYFITVYDKAGGKELWRHRFRHPFPKGTTVCILPPPDGDDTPPRPTLFVRNKAGTRLFSSSFTVRDVTDGAIQSDTRAFQFLER